MAYFRLMEIEGMGGGGLDDRRALIPLNGPDLPMCLPSLASRGLPSGFPRGVAFPESSLRSDPSERKARPGAETRAGFSDFAGEPELLVNIEGCDYSGKDLTKDVLSGVKVGLKTAVPDLTKPPYR
eukprot:779711-Prorocentrum_minimum.AAC.2